MKRLITALLLILFSVTTAMGTVGNSWEVAQGEGKIKYTVLQGDTTVSIQKGSVNPTGNLIIPESVTNGDKIYKVVTIGICAFEECSDLKKVEISNSVVIIGLCAFYKCSQLTSVKISNSVTVINESAFSDCENLSNLEIGNNVKSIGTKAFLGCKSLISLDIPDRVESIGEKAFYGCKKLTNVVIGNSVKGISEEAFYDCEKLANIKFGNSTEWIGENAFVACKGLTSIKIPSNIKIIYSTAFYGCRSLTKVEIVDSLEWIGYQAFMGCSSLDTLKLGNTQNIDEWAFTSCESLTNVEIPNSIEWIGKEAFMGCDNLINITVLNNNPPKASNDAFIYLPSNAKVKIPQGSTSAYDPDGDGKWQRLIIIEGDALAPEDTVSQKATYELSFDANGGTGEVTPQTYYEGKTLSLPTPTKTGYTFDGWKIGATVLVNGTAWNYTENKEATAQWRVIEYTITYNLASGEFKDGETILSTYTVEDEITLPIATAWSETYDMEAYFCVSSSFSSSINCSSKFSIFFWIFSRPSESF